MQTDPPDSGRSKERKSVKEQLFRAKALSLLAPLLTDRCL
jgi:hypothetical protein